MINGSDGNLGRHMNKTARSVIHGKQPAVASNNARIQRDDDIVIADILAESQGVLKVERLWIH